MSETKPDTERYLQRIEMQHSIRPKFMAVVTELLEKLDSAHGIMKAVPELYNIETAEGAQLDVIGELVNVIRKDIPEIIPGITRIPDDDLYRTILKARIAQDNWDGTNEGLNEIWATTASNLIELQYTDNQNMSMDATIYGDVDEEVALLLDNEYIIPKPMGVTLNTIIHVDSQCDPDKLYLGIAIYGKVENSLGTIPMPDLSQISPLVDETDALLLDETWTLLEG